MTQVHVSCDAPNQYRDTARRLQLTHLRGENMDIAVTEINSRSFHIGNLNSLRQESAQTHRGLAEAFERLGDKALLALDSR